MLPITIFTFRISQQDLGFNVKEGLDIKYLPTYLDMQQQRGIEVDEELYMIHKQS